MQGIGKIIRFLNKSDKRITVMQGGARCFGPDQQVITRKGSEKISDIQPGREVLTYNEQTKKREYKRVKESLKFANTKTTIKIKLTGGEEIIVTDDHEFFYHGKWMPIKDILILWSGR